MLSFVSLGVFWGTWAVALADIQQTFHLSDGALGILLSVSIGLAALNGAVMSHHAEHWGTARMLTVALAAWGVLLMLAGAAPTLPLFVVAFIAAEVAGGSVDAAMNAAVTHRLAGRPGALVRFHALFNSGALMGAAAAGVLLHAGVSWRWLWPGLGAAVGALALWTATSSRQDARRRDPADHRAYPTALAPGQQLPDPAGAGDLGPAGDPTPADPAARRRPSMLGHLRTDRLVLFLVVFAVAEVIEGGVDTWGVLYLRTELAAGVLLGAGAYVMGQTVAATTRGAGGPLLGRLQARIALVVGGLVAGGGILLESTSHITWLAAVGLALGAGGASLFWPLVMSEAMSSSSRPTAVIGAFTAAGYVGWVAGAPVIGFVSDTWGLARGLQLLAALALLVAVAALAHRNRGARRPGTPATPG